MSSPQMTPQQAFQVLTQELSASGSDPLTDNDGSTFTLRGAIKRILWKVNFLLPLAGRPVSPTQTDDLYGHVLSARAEGLVTQAILASLAGKLGVDIATIRNQVMESFNANTTPESFLPWDPKFVQPTLDTGLLSGVTGAITSAEQAVTHATQIGSEVAAGATAAATTAAAEAAAAAAGAVKAAGDVVGAVVSPPTSAPGSPAAPTSPVPGGGLDGGLISVIEQAALGAAKSTSAAVLPGIEKAIEARVAATVQAEAADLLKRLEGGAGAPPVPSLDDFTRADGRVAAFRTLLIGIVLSGLWGLVNVLGNIATVDWHNRDALPQVLSIAVTAVVGSVVAYVGRIAHPPAHIVNATIIPGGNQS